MYKLKYYSLTKEEKQKLKEEFYQTEFGQMLKKRLDRVFIIGIMSLVFGIFLILTKNNIWDLISGISLLIAAVVFLIGSFKVRIDKLNLYYAKTKKK